MLAYTMLMDAPARRTEFEQIYHRYRNLMYHIAYKILGNAEDAEDAVHEAFVYLAENFSKISDPECPKTKAYIVTIIESKAIDLYRQKRRRTTVPLEDNIPGIQPDLDRAGDIARCMAKLPKQYAHVLVLKYSHGYTAKEIGKLLHISPSAAAKLAQRAKARLEEICQEEGVS